MNITLVTNFIVPSSLLYAPEKRPQSHQRVNVSIFPTLLCVRSYSSTWPLMLMPRRRRSRHVVGVMIDVFQLSHMTLNTLPNV